MAGLAPADLADWRRFCDGIAESDHAMFAARGTGSGSTPHPRDAAVLYALRDRAYQAITRATLALEVSRGALVLDVPAAYWLRPQLVEGADLFGVRVHLCADAAWPSLRLELPRG